MNTKKNTSSYIIVRLLDTKPNEKQSYKQTEEKDTWHAKNNVRITAYFSLKKKKETRGNGMTSLE